MFSRVWKPDETLALVFEIVLQLQQGYRYRKAFEPSKALITVHVETYFLFSIVHLQS